LCAVLCLCALLTPTEALTAQLKSNAMTKHTFLHQTASFGPRPGEYSVSGIAFVPEKSSLGCFANAFNAISIHRKIVLVERGNCSFAEKAQLAQSAGAVGIVVGDSDARAEDLVVMSLEENEHGNNLTIPAVFVTSSTFKKLLVMMSQDSVQITLNGDGEVETENEEVIHHNAISKKELIIAGVVSMLCATWVVWMFARGMKCKRQRQLLASKDEVTEAHAIVAVENKVVVYGSTHFDSPMRT
jgi:hypothetical protein